MSSKPQPRAVYVKVSDEDIVKTHCNAGDTVNVDVDYYGVPVGVEVLGALSVTVDGVEVTPQASSAERGIEVVAQVLRDCKKVVRDEQDYEVFCAKRVLAALNGIEASR